MKSLLRSLNTVLLVAGCVVCAGCFRWAPVSQPIPEQKRWGYVRVMQVDSSRFTYINNARARSDTLNGTFSAGMPAAGEPARIAVDEILSLEHSSLDVLRTGGVIVGSLAAVILGLYLSFTNREGDF